MAISGQVAIVTPGEAVQATDTPTGVRFALKAHPNNSGLILISNLSTSGSTGGFPLSAGQQVERKCKNLSGLYFNGTIANDKLTWLLME